MSFKKYSLKTVNLVTMLESIKLYSFRTEKRAVRKNTQSMKFTLKLDDIDAEVIQKKIKNLNLRICPPDGKIRISAPLHVSQEKICKFAFSKLEWIRKQRKRMHNQERPLPERFLENESHYFCGQAYPLKIIINNNSPFAELSDQQIILNLPPNAPTAKRRAVLNEWYRGELMRLIPPLINKWENILNVSITSFHIRSMKTRWGSCTPKTGRVRFNLELAKRSPECLEYIVVHELVHLLEASHNSRFKALMDQFYPDWRLCRKELHSLGIPS
ncbi:MAG: SprT family zinc-dependent metalloprotease [SAR324 cluster bacterium]|nr:SprT family zinc-dependent metalloprotease [SAR324 cluster bacterium]